MARTYAKLMLSIWEDDDFRNVSSSAQRLYMLLLSNKALSAAGCLPLQTRKWSRLAGDTDQDALADALDELVTNGFLLVDNDTEEVLIRTFIRHDGGAHNKNLRKAIESAIDRIESPQLQEHAATELDRQTGNDQHTDPDEGRPEDPPPDPSGDGQPDPSEHADEGAPEGASEPTCHLSPVTCHLPPGQSVRDENFHAVVDKAVDRLTEAFPPRGIDPATHRKKLANDVIAKHGDEITQALRLYPERSAQFHARQLNLGSNVA